MGIIRNLVNLFSGNQQDERKPVDTDKDGTLLFKEDIIEYVKSELDRRKQERQPLENQWRLNSNFLSGNQYCDINTYSGEIEQLEPIHDWLEREVFNRIAPLIETRIANLKKIKYKMKVKPATNEIDDYAKAETSTAILHHKQENSDFDSKKNTMILWNELCGNCFWLSWWDKDAGEEYAREQTTEIDEDGNEQSKTNTFNEGDVDYGLITPYEIFPESVYKQGVQNQRSIIIEQVMTVDEIFDKYGVEVEGASIDTFSLTPLPVAGGYGWEGTVNTLGHRTVSDSQKVITYFERKSRRYPEGRLIIIIGDEHLAYYGDLPYHCIPIQQVVCKEVSGMFYGKSVIEELIPLQRAYNGVVNRIHEYIKGLVLSDIFAEEDSVDIDDYAENGKAPCAVIVYRQGSQPPQPMQNGVLPNEVFNEREQLKQDMEYVAAVSQLMVIGQAPSGVTSGTAIESLRDIDNTRLSLTGDHIRNSIKGNAKDWLAIYKRYAVTSRIIKSVGTNAIGDAMIWSNEDINSYDIEFDTINELELSEEVQKQHYFDAFKMGLFTDDKGQIPQRVKQQMLEFMKQGNYTEIMNINQLQMQAAQRENTFFGRGVIPDISGIDDHAIHEEEHTRYALQMQFQLLKMKKPEYADALLQHLAAHKQIVELQKRKELMQMGAVPQ